MTLIELSNHTQVCCSPSLIDAQEMVLYQHRFVAPMQDTNQRVEKARQEMQELGITASGV